MDIDEPYAVVQATEDKWTFHAVMVYGKYGRCVNALKAHAEAYVAVYQSDLPRRTLAMFWTRTTVKPNTARTTASLKWLQCDWQKKNEVWNISHTEACRLWLTLHSFHEDAADWSAHVDNAGWVARSDQWFVDAALREYDEVAQRWSKARTLKTESNEETVL